MHRYTNSELFDIYYMHVAEKGNSLTFQNICMGRFPGKNLLDCRTFKILHEGGGFSQVGHYMLQSMIRALDDIAEFFP